MELRNSNTAVSKTLLTKRFSNVVNATRREPPSAQKSIPAMHFVAQDLARDISA
jgi:hypothetical protein